jgi:hypothetical protein
VGIAGLVWLWRKGPVKYGKRSDDGVLLTTPPGLDDTMSWVPPAPVDPITFLVDWDEDEPAFSSLPPPHVAAPDDGGPPIEEPRAEAPPPG